MIQDIFFAVIKVPHPIKENEQIVSELTTLHLNLIGASHISHYPDMASAITAFQSTDLRYLVAIETGIFIKQDADLFSLLSSGGTRYEYFGKGIHKTDGVDPRAYLYSRATTWWEQAPRTIKIVPGEVMDSSQIYKYFRDIEYRDLGPSFTNILSQPIYMSPPMDGDGRQDLTDDQRWFKTSTFGKSIHSPFYGNREMVFSAKSPSIINTDHYISDGDDYSGPEAIWKSKSVETVSDLLLRDHVYPSNSIGMVNSDRIRNQKLDSWLESNKLYVHNPFYKVNNQAELSVANPDVGTLGKSSWKDWLISSVPSRQPEIQDSQRWMSFGFPSYIRWRKRQIDIGVFYSTLPPLDTIKLLHENRTNDSTRVLYLRKNISLYEKMISKSFHTGYGDHFESVATSMDYGGQKIHDSVKELLWSNTLEKFGGEEKFKDALNRYQRMKVDVLNIDDLSFDGDTDIYINFGHMFCSISNIVNIPLVERNRGFSELMKKVEACHNITAEGYDPLGKRIIFRT